MKTSKDLFNDLDSQVVELMDAMGVPFKVGPEDEEWGLVVEIDGACGGYHRDKDYILITSNAWKDFQLTNTVLHELVHATGHRTRLDRGVNPRVATREQMCLEEQVAQYGALLLLVHFKLDTPEIRKFTMEYIEAYHVNYGDYRKDALKAVDYILEKYYASKRAKEA